MFALTRVVDYGNIGRSMMVTFNDDQQREFHCHPVDWRVFRAVVILCCVYVCKASDKVALILDIWRACLGVVLLHVFPNVMGCEAYTREACMIDALGESQICTLPRCSRRGICFSCLYLL